MADDELSGELRALARAHGVLASYVDHSEVPRRSPTDSIVAVLEALGEPRAGSDPRGALAELRARHAVRLAEPVVVVASGNARRVPLLDAAHAVPLECELTTEHSETRTWTSTPDLAGPPTRTVEIPGELEAGYHTLRLDAGGAAATVQLLARPPGGARGRFDDAWRAFGVTAPTFSLHSARTWGCGDLADLDALAATVAGHGASVVATLPLLAGFGPESFEPSPYLPSSREYWHERWIDVDGALGDGPPSRTAALAEDVRRNVRAAAAAAHPYVDGARAMVAQRTVLQSLLAELEDAEDPRLVGLDAYLAARPDVERYARFRAAGDRFGVDWHRWPVRARDGDLSGVDARAARYHAFVQWLVHDQLVAVARRCEDRGQVLSLDLPLGVHPDGYDVWRHRDQFVHGLSVGAPPDRFFPSGQRWSFPPPDLAVSRADGHALFRAALAHHLGVARMLRLDHVLGLQRLFCVPDGATPAAGVYVERPLEELLAVVAIEAQRHHATIVGEDLGTVDAAVRRAMARDGLRRFFVVELAVGRGDGAVFPAPPPGSVASFATHDLATFEGWWEGRDVEELAALGQVDRAGHAAMAARRREDKRTLATLVDGDGRAPTPPEGLLTKVLDELSGSDAGLVLIQLDDLVGEREAVNLPGTSVERRNWARRTEEPLESLAADPALAGELDALRERRPTEEDLADRAIDPDPVDPVDLIDHAVTRVGELDAYLLAEGRHARLHNVLGAHAMTVGAQRGTYFAVLAPAARRVEVVGDFNGWDGTHHALAPHGTTGVFEGFVAGVLEGVRYKYRLTTAGGAVLDKADPFARRTESPPLTASMTGEPHHEWRDAAWMAARAQYQARDRPISVYEVHVGSWRRVVEEGHRPLTYRELAPQLIEHVQRLGFTHVELLPVMEHPYYGSWGYQVTGFFAPSARYGEPDDFAALVDELHRAGIGVLLDWVPAHFPADEFALATFDGTHLYEHGDPRRRVHPDWQSLIFDYGRPEVRSFLMSAACYWLERYHVDGLRFDAVASMLYLDYSRAPGEWTPNAFGGHEDLEAVAFAKMCNNEIHRAFPGALTIAEESTSWPGVTAPTTDGGLGFDYKWDLGWMHDTLAYLHRDPVHRRWHQDELTFRAVYARTEQFLLPLSHDEVVHGKGSLLERMSGDAWQRFANLRLLLGYQLLQPGKKLLFMGGELGQDREWGHDRSIDWHLLERPEHHGLVALVARLNALYRECGPLHRDDLEDRGFAWIDGSDREHSVICVARHDDRGARLVIACNATPEPRHRYDVGMPAEGAWALRCSSDELAFGGSGFDVPTTVATRADPLHGRPWRATLELPPLGFVIYAHDATVSGGEHPVR